MTDDKQCTICGCGAGIKQGGSPLCDDCLLREYESVCNEIDELQKLNDSLTIQNAELLTHRDLYDQRRREAMASCEEWRKKFWKVRGAQGLRVDAPVYIDPSLPPHTTHIQVGDNFYSYNSETGVIQSGKSSGRQEAFEVTITGSSLMEIQRADGAGYGMIEAKIQDWLVKDAEMSNSQAFNISKGIGDILRDLEIDGYLVAFRQDCSCYHCGAHWPRGEKDPHSTICKKCAAKTAEFSPNENGG